MKNKQTHPFDILINELPAPSLDFKFNKLLQANNSRKVQRIAGAGFAIIYNEDGEPIAKADVTDVSSNGVRVKTSTLSIQPGSFITIEIVRSGARFGPITCTVRWIGAVDVHLKYQAMGVEFAVIVPAFKEKFSK